MEKSVAWRTWSLGRNYMHLLLLKWQHVAIQAMPSTPLQTFTNTLLAPLGAGLAEAAYDDTALSRATQIPAPVASLNYYIAIKSHIDYNNALIKNLSAAGIPYVSGLVFKRLWDLFTEMMAESIRQPPPEANWFRWNFTQVDPPKRQLRTRQQKFNYATYKSDLTWADSLYNNWAKHNPGTLVGFLPGVPFGTLVFGLGAPALLKLAGDIPLSEYGEYILKGNKADANAKATTKVIWETNAWAFRQLPQILVEADERFDSNVFKRGLQEIAELHEKGAQGIDI